MALEINWTPLATKSLAEILIYLECEWSLKIAEGFVKELEYQLEIIRVYPEIGIQSSKNNLVRRVLITKHNALYYLVEDEKLMLLNFYDTRTFKYQI
ncbi:MAG: type II toxin-antitoxin system RelE/ParE family toxin [Bacteroidota bacterium]|nr:type II toxin-antitoxin system RelE/ParE family toxin [Bacteroidota bacterium]